MILGILAGLWLAYAVASHLVGSPRRGLNWIECAVVLPELIAVIGWALVIGPQQAGGAYVGPFLFAVGLTATLRLLLAARNAGPMLSRMSTELGIVSAPAATA